MTGCLSKVNINPCDRHSGRMRDLSRGPALVITTELAVAAGGLDRRGALLLLTGQKEAAPSVRSWIASRARGAMRADRSYSEEA